MSFSWIAGRGNLFSHFTDRTKERREGIRHSTCLHTRVLVGQGRRFLIRTIMPYGKNLVAIGHLLGIYLQGGS